MDTSAKQKHRPSRQARRCRAYARLGDCQDLCVCILQSLPPPQAVPLPQSEGGLIGFKIIVNLTVSASYCHLSLHKRGFYSVILIINHISVYFPLGHISSIRIPLSTFAVDIVFKHMITDSFLNKRICLGSYNRFFK